MSLYNESRNAGHYSNLAFTALYHKANLKRGLLLLFFCLRYKAKDISTFVPDCVAQLVIDLFPNLCAPHLTHHITLANKIQWRVEKKLPF